MKDSVPPRENDMKPFPIAGIGASAGGLEALIELFKNLPVDTGLGFIVVQHLAPSKSSTLPEILQRSTRMPAQQAEDGLQVQPDNIYIIPPGKNMAILQGKLQLFDQVGPAAHILHPIDTFLESLARDRGPGAIAIILSGTGTDGTIGSRTVKAELGMVIAQDPETAAYDGMPRSVVEAGLADFVLPPGKMADQILSYVHRLPNLVTAATIESPGLLEALPKLVTLIRDRTGNDFSEYKEGTLQRRITRRMALQQIEKAEDYVRFLQQHPEEITTLVKELLINVTSFFRDRDAFEALKPLLKELLKDKPVPREVRAWVAGCSTGEEAYSLAILFQECLEELGKSLKLQVFATDLDSDAINIARTGIYRLNIAQNITPQRLQRFFTKLDDTYQVNKDIREMVTFAVHNIIKDPPFLRLELISSRNLLIYLKGDLQKKLLPLFHYALNPSGILFLSPSETVGEFTELFQIVDRKWKIYQCKEVESRLPNLLSLSLRPASSLTTDNKKGGPRIRNTEISQIAERILLSEYAPAFVVVDSAYNVVFVRGDTGKYLKLAEGRTSMNILDLARKGLRTHLSLALHKAVSQNAEVSTEGVKVGYNGNVQMITLTVRPLASQKLPDYLMIIFRETQPHENIPGEAKSHPGRKNLNTSELDQRVTELEQELKESQENLKNTVEEVETSNEELKAANEELLSSNEELQSTNEELETSREEMRSVNEELSTVNTENQDRIEQLTRSQDDMRNLLNTIEVATVFLDSDLNIKSFTPAVTKIFSLRENDIGRPIKEITSALNYEGLSIDTRETLQTLATITREVKTKDGRWYSMRIIPYRTRENAITGVVLTFIDIDEKRILQAALGYTQSIVDTVREPMLVLDKELKVVSANRSFYRTFQVEEKETVGKLVYKLGNKQWDIPELRKLLEEILPGNHSFVNYEVDKEFPHLGRKKMLLNARRLYEELGSQRILLAFEDVNGRKD